jgi:predicted enzyme related to lactoylglutathione lyase
MAELLINIDVDDLARARAFYTEAFGLEVGRQLGKDFLELLGAPAPIYLLQQPAGAPPFPGAERGRDYDRHWSPVHLDFVVEDIAGAVARAVAAGAKLERAVVQEPYGLLAVLSDPFGHGFCFLEFQGEGYDAIATG